MNQRRRLTNEEKFELLKMYYKEGRTDLTGTKYEGYNVPSIRANLRAEYNKRTLKMDPELLKKFEGEYFLQREKSQRTSDEDKYNFLMKFYEENPEADRSEYSFAKKYEEGKKVKAYINHLQVKHNRGKDTLAQEQLDHLIESNLLHYSSSEKEEIAQKYGICVEWIDAIQKKIGKIENLEDLKKEDYKRVLEIPVKDRFIWNGREDALESQKIGYVRLIRSIFRMEAPNLNCIVVNPELINEKLETLLEREKIVLRERFGLETGEAKLLGEIGQEFGVKRERIRQIEKRALREMRHPSRRQEIEEEMLSYTLEENMKTKKKLEQRIEILQPNKTEYEKMLAEDSFDEEIRKLNRLKNIDELGLSIRAYNCLKRKGIKTVEDLTQYTVEDIMKIRNMGQKIFKEILRKIRRIRNRIER